MVCGENAGALELHFIVSGIRVRPIEGRIEEDIRELQRGVFTLNQAAGELINSEAKEAEPVLVKLGNNVAYRMVIMEDAIEFRRSLDRRDVAELELIDAIAVLTRGLISKKFSGTVPRNPIEYILGRRNDPNNVITGTQFLDDSFKERMKSRIRPTSPPRAAGDPLDLVFEALTSGRREKIASADFNNMTPYEALTSVLNILKTGAWVDNDGTLLIGPHIGWGEVLGVLETEDIPKLANYTITEAAQPTKRIIVKGGLEKPDIFGFDIGDGRLTIHATATRTDVDSGHTKETNRIEVTSLKAAENAAIGALIDETMEGSSGTIEFNGFTLTEEEQEKVARARVGDHIVVDATVPKACDRRYIGGHFNIRSIQHRFNNREGWRIITEVAKMPQQGNIKIDSWVYNPRTGIRYEDIDAYVGRVGEEG